MKTKYLILFLLGMTMISCTSKQNSIFSGAKGEVKLINLNPGHFHAALVQKFTNPEIDSNVFVYAPQSEDVDDYLDLINSYNSREENPANWKEVVYKGSDFLEKMLNEKPGNVVIISGNNERKTEYINSAVNAGLNVLADKPMVINTEDFELLKQSYETARQNGVLLYDIMTERSEITTILQQQLSLIPEIFGTLEKGTPEDPAVIRESIHNFYKYVSGSLLKRPAWFFDVSQQGEGVVDITTHLVDLIQWECFPNQILDYTKDIQILSAKRWPTKLTLEEFSAVTRLDQFPAYLKKYIKNDTLNVYCNGEINYLLKGVHAKVYIVWNYRAPEDAGDAVYSIMRGTKSNLVIRQGAEQNYKPTLYVEPIAGIDTLEFHNTVIKNFTKISSVYEGVSFQRNNQSWEIIIPEKFDVGHEAHFADVTNRFIKYLIDGKLPDWEIPNILAKYYTTTKALELAKQK